MKMAQPGRNRIAPFLPIGLELEASRNLHIARRPHRRDRAESGLVSIFRSQVGGSRIGQAGYVQRGVDSIELRVIQGVERIQAKFESSPLLNAELLGER